MNALIVSADSDTRALVQRVCSSRASPISIVREMPGMLSLGGSVSLGKPGLIFFDARGPVDKALEELARFSAKHPKALLILLAPVHSPDLLIAAMRIGVREVVSLPVDPAELNAAIDRLNATVRDADREDGKVISIVSSKGGSGTTFIAANLGYGLSGIGQKKTLLIDLNLQFGDAALFLSDEKPAMTMADLCTQIARLDEHLLRSGLVHVTQDYDVLAASPNADPDDRVRPDHVAAILALARKHYDFVLLDAGRQVNAITIRAMDASDLIMPVLQQSLPFIRNGQRMLDMYTTLGYRKDNIRQILNRYEDANPISRSDMERALGHRIAHILPNNFDIANESINQGEPVLRLARGSNLSKALVEMVHSLTEAPVSDSRNLIRRLFVRNPVATH